MSDITINYPTEIKGLDGFQVKVVNQNISNIVKEYKIGFDYDIYNLKFLIYPVNLRLNIELWNFESYFDDDDFNYFEWINNYVDKVSLQLKSTDITFDLLHEDFDTEYVDLELERFDFLTWGVINKCITPESCEKE